MKAPVGYTAKVSDIEVMQFSRPVEADDIVEWGEGAIRHEPPFLTVVSNKGRIVVESGQFIAKTATGFKVLTQQELDDNYVCNEVEDEVGEPDDETQDDVPVGEPDVDVPEVDGFVMGNVTDDDSV